MVKIQNISEIHPTLGFTEFDILEKYRKSFNESELGWLNSVFLFERIAKTVGLSERNLGRRNIFSPSAKISFMVLKAYTGFSDRQLVEHLNGNIHYQMFCGIIIAPSFPITNYKSAKGTGFIAGRVLHSAIHRITGSGFPSLERFLYRKRKCLKGRRSVTVSSALTVIMYVP